MASCMKSLGYSFSHSFYRKPPEFKGDYLLPTLNPQENTVGQA